MPLIENGHDEQSAPSYDPRSNGSETRSTTAKAPAYNDGLTDLAMLHKLYLPNPHRVELRDALVARSKAEPSHGTHNVGGWRSNDNLLDTDTPAIGWLKRELKSVLNNLPINFKTKTLRAWGVVNPPGAYHNRHIHRWGFSWSGIYYIDPGGDNSGQTILEIKGVEVAITPEPDLLIIFPFNIWHRVEPHGGDRPRVVISIDAG